MLKAIIFDFDGVLVDTEALHYQATIHALKEHKVHFSYDVYCEKYIGMPDLLMFPLIGERYGVNVNDLELKSLLAKKQQAYHEMDLRSLPTCPGAFALAKEAAKHLPLAICTGAHRVDIDQLLPFLEHGELNQCFKIVVTSDDVRRTKPDPEGYLSAAEQLGIAPENCLVIEDTPVGIQAGKSAGMKVLGVCTSHNEAQLYQADKVVHRLSAINFEQLKALYLS